jgi:hypothetical protein
VHVNYAEKVLDNCLGKEYVDYKVNSGIIVRSVISPDSPLPPKSSSSKRSSKKKTAPAQQQHQKQQQQRQLASDSEISYESFMASVQRRSGSGSGSRSGKQYRSKSQNLDPNHLNKPHRSVVGARRINASIPYNKQAIELLLLANRQLTVMEMQKKTTERDLQSCCNDALIHAMHGQAVPIERVHFMVIHKQLNNNN